MATQAHTLETKARARKDVLGRSAATGKLVLKPASAPGSVTDEQVREVIRAVRRDREVGGLKSNA